MDPAKRVWFGLLLAAMFGIAAGLFRGVDADLIVGIAIVLAALPRKRSRATTRGI